MPKRKRSVKSNQPINSTTSNDNKAQSCVIDYEQLKIAIIHAHNEIQEQKRIEQKKEIENDYLTQLIKGLMNTLMFLGVVAAIIAIAVSTFYTYSSTLSDSISKILAWSFWISFYLLTAVFTIIMFKQKNRQNFVLQY